MTRPLLVAVFTAILCAATARAALAQPTAAAPVRVLASTGVRSVLEAVQTEAERAVGRPLAIQFGASRALKDEIESGRPFELAIVTPDVLEDGIAKGAVLNGSRSDLAQTLVAIAQRGGTPGDISQPANLRARLLGAKAIRTNPIGSIRPTVDKMFAGLGLDPATFGNRIRPLPTTEDPAAALNPGEYELTIVLDSEVAQLAPGAAKLGPIPAPFQVPVVMSAGLGAQGDAKAGAALIAYLRSPAAGRVLTANHMQPLVAQPANH